MRNLFIGEFLLSMLKRKSTPEGITAVVLEERGFSMARIAPDISGRPSLELCVFEDCSSASEVGPALASAVRANKLRGAPCVVVLRSELYSLRQIDAPAVQPNEMREAARWAIKDLIDFRVEDGVIDVFGVPAAAGKRAHRIYVSATPSSVIREVVETIEDAGLSLFAIDITELALRNLAVLLPEDKRGMALMFLSGESGVLTITKGGDLYMARRVHSDLELIAEIGSSEPLDDKPEQSEEAEQLLKSLLLETQRSLDYYEHQLQQGPVAAFVLVPGQEPLSGLRRYLSANLLVEVSMLDINTVLRSSDHLPQPLQARCVTAIGGALRPKDEPE